MLSELMSLLTSILSITLWHSRIMFEEVHCDWLSFHNGIEFRIPISDHGISVRMSIEPKFMSNLLQERESNINHLLHYWSIYANESVWIKKTVRNATWINWEETWNWFYWSSCQIQDQGNTSLNKYKFIWNLYCNIQYVFAMHTEKKK